MPSELLYRIVDEPAESPWRRLVVRPLWPWLSMAFGGLWVGVPWFIVNAIALGSPTRRREIVLAGLSPLLVVVLFVGVVIVRTAFPGIALGYLLIPYQFFKLLVGYLLFTWQARAFQLHEHFGGEGANGVVVLIAAALVREPVLAALGKITVFLSVAAS